jgi:mRNA interferase MazF
MTDRRAVDAGDIVWVDFDPIRETEQGGTRPAFVLTDRGFNTLSARAVVCPITRTEGPWPTKVWLPDGMKTKGAILVDQVRAVDRSQRGFRYVESAPDEVLAEVRAILAVLLGVTS